MRAAVVVVGALVAALAAPAQAETLRFAYVGTSGGYNVVEREVQAYDTPAGRLAVLGNFEFIPTTSSFTLTIDDATVADGRSVPVEVYQHGRNGRKVTTCAKAGPPLRLTGFLPGRRVTVFIVSAADDGPLNRRGCDDFATAGTAYVGL